jgi:putative acyl-CoA dehydrogenase
MRQALSQAAHHVAHRRAFQRALIDQPIMTNVVADMALEVEAATWLAFRFVAALEREGKSEAERLLTRIGAPIAKYWICKRAPAIVAEAIECHGGNGFIEDHLMARLYREAPLNGIWEGTGNVICLDVLRSMTREPDCIPALFDELRAAAGADRTFDGCVASLLNELSDLRKHEGQARRLVERLALLLSASLLLRHAPHEVADAFIATRLAGGWAGQFGDLSVGLDAARIARRAVPEVASTH